MAVSRINEAGLNVNQYGNRNLVINGAMQVAQRATSTTGIGASSVFGSVDRFQVASGTTGRVTMAQDSVTDLAGFTKCIKISCTTARTPSASELMFLRYAWEGHDLQRISKGTASAKATKISFYVKASGVFNMACELYDADNNRHISQLFATSTSWNRIELDIPADTTGAYGDDNGPGLLMQLWFHGGTDRTSGTLPSTWQTKSSNTNQAAGISNFLSSTSNEFYFTGLQYEVGDTATPFEHRSYGDELARCQRYYSREEAGSGAAYKRYGVGSWNSATHFECSVPLSTPMRTTPTLETTGTASNYAIYSANAIDAVTSLALINDSDAGTYNRMVGIIMTVSSGGVAGEGGTLLANNDEDNFLAFDAEL